MAWPPKGAPAPSTGRPRELNTTQAVLPMVAEAAVTPVLQAGEKAMVVCVFGGAVAMAPKLNVTPVDSVVLTPSSTHCAAVLSQRSSTKVRSMMLARTRARVKAADARILASPTILVIAWASFL